VAAVLGMPVAPALGQATWFVTAAIPVAVLPVFIQRRLRRARSRAWWWSWARPAPRVPR